MLVAINLWFVTTTTVSGIYVFFSDQHAVCIHQWLPVLIMASLSLPSLSYHVTYHTCEAASAHGNQSSTHLDIWYDNNHLPLKAFSALTVSIMLRTLLQASSCCHAPCLVSLVVGWPTPSQHQAALYILTYTFRQQPCCTCILPTIHPPTPNPFSAFYCSTFPDLRWWCMSKWRYGTLTHY